MSGDILAINAGSSTLKFALFETGSGNTLALVAKGEIEGIGTAHHRLRNRRLSEEMAARSSQ